MAPEDFRLMLDYSSDVHWMVDCQAARLLYVSPAAGRLLGREPAQLQAMADTLLVDLPARLVRFEQGDESRRTVRRETELDGRDGPVPVEIESTLVGTEAGLRLVGVVRDIRARRAVAQEQKKFTSMLNHEFRTPLATIDGAIQRLEMTQQHADEATRKRYRKIQDAVDRLLGMIDEYLSPDRMSSIGRERQADTIDPVALLQTVGEAARQRRATVSVACADLPKRLRADPAGIRLCLEVLLDNAIKYTSAESPIHLGAAKASKGGVEFVVSDTGPAIPDDELGRIFDKGYRGRSAALIPGSGLGLYMAKSIVEVHGGNISVENLLQSGKIFRIWLPIAV
ncbi:PAS domain-containing sensor histidine kinase [Pseudoduganella chitinolytica]|uniref:histidine kinase n=1 Tax=Pseudoduganella chitinolytica TaxID=34070 RepID=A0ABY8B853_9BURK|nr:PAS domain-containing sensor histidine kinase [Pseudoduganella chitinolytica]WEF32116.1 PAS domain-containing sensor histidine kinase [Pseudoduganella chitinolytica]